MRQPLITAEAIGLTRDNSKILDNVSLNIAADDFITVVGPNGAGKTTLLKCLLGLIKPTQGRLKRQAGLRVGYMPQRITAARTMPLSLHYFLALNKNSNAREIAEIAELTNITQHLQTPLAELSGGEMQRALLARALLNHPTLLALDEPVQNLDVGGEIAFYHLLENICDTRKVAVLMVSHDLHFVMRRSRQVVCLYHHVCCSGTPQVVSQDPQFKALFGNEMAELMTVYQHEHDHHHTDTGETPNG
ncbi:MAG: ATP-binding cassette domain-containing protein [Proteobacteria bacterium]|nr:ATP-binding cassette domain-containing protein [Pseudomonadota bacterium]MCH9758191.1 ATP-binding cassette domain-containing protein [Pseudomonadota bacterium]